MRVIFKLSNRNLSLHIPCPGEQPLWWTVLELVVFVFLVQAGLWTYGVARGKVVMFGVAWILFTTLWDKTTSKEMGLSLKSFAQKVEILFWPVVMVVIAIWLGSFFTETARQNSYAVTFMDRKLGYFLWAFCQQFLMQSYVFTRLQKIVRLKASWVTAILFSLAHLPNPVLMVITLGSGWVSSTLFNRHRNLYALALAHGVIGAALASWWPPWVMRVGVGFLMRLNGS